MAGKLQNSYCVLPDNNLAFWQIIEEIDIPERIKVILRNSKIEKVYIDSQRNAWNIYTLVDELIDEINLIIVEDYIKAGCQLTSVRINQKVSNDDLELEIKEHIEKYFKNYCQHNLLKLMLGDIRIKYPEIDILVRGSFTIDILKEQKANLEIQNYLKKFFKNDLLINFKQLLTEETPKTIKDDKETISIRHTANVVKTNSDLIFGKVFKGNIREIAEITQEESRVVIAGKINNLKILELRTKRILLSFDIVDKTDGLSCKIFFKDKQEYEQQARKIKAGLLVKALGDVQHDKFAKQELVMTVKGLQLLPETHRIDNSIKKRVELHLHTKMSSLDALVSIKDCIKTAAKWGHKAIAITDHGVVQAFPEAYEVAAKEKIKLIYGMEGYLFEDDNPGKYWHIIILAKNEIGLRNLYRLVSLSHLKYLYKRPRIPRSILQEYREGLILGSACEAGELYQALLKNLDNDKIDAIANFYDYLEIQPIANNSFMIRKGIVENEEKLYELNKEICALGKRLNKKVVATCDVHFLNPEDEIFRRILMAGQGYSDAEFQPPLYLRTTEEMLQEFAYLGEELAQEVVVENTQAIAAEIDDFKPIPDELYSPKIDGAEEAVRDMSYLSAEKLYAYQGELPEIVKERLEQELNSIINNGFAVLYLIAHKLVKKSLDDGYLVGSRGSVGSSFVATMMNITEVNPLSPHWHCSKCKYSEFLTDGSYASGFDLPEKNCPHCQISMIRNGHDIPFAVFMGFHGDKVPDIDLNFSGDYQPNAHKYTEELFGRDNVFRAGTISTLADKTAYGFVKKYYESSGIQAREAKINALVSGCTGVKRTTGQHPGGIMVVPRDMDIHYFTPIQRPADDKESNTITTHFDYHSISSRLVKLDILGHDDPTVIRMLEDITGIDAMQIPVGDEATMSLFYSCEALGIKAGDINSSVGTFGIPEFGTKFVRQMLEDIKPNKFSQLVRVSGFSHGTDVWLNNAQDIIRNKVADVSETISARDDIMVYLIQKGVENSLAFKIMENVRKGKGVSPEQAEEMRRNNVPDWYIDSCNKIKYMFPKAHAVAYVLMAYRIAYCKVHYPLAFYAAYFSIRADEFDAAIITKGKDVIKTNIRIIEQKGNDATTKEKSLLTILELALEMLVRGFNFKKIDLYRSDSKKFLIEENSLLPPLSALQGVGSNAAINIVAAREHGEFSSKEDVATRAKVSKTVIEKLTEHGALDELPDTNQLTLFA